MKAQEIILNKDELALRLTSEDLFERENLYLVKYSKRSKFYYKQKVSFKDHKFHPTTKKI